MKTLFLLFTSMLFLVEVSVASDKLVAGGKKFSVMTYNLENLFDNKHDTGKNDWTYLSYAEKQVNEQAQAYCNAESNEYYRRTCFELDWSDENIEAKVKNLAKVIKSYENGPDIIVFQEIENINAVKILINKGLKNTAYKYHSLIEGPDTRGIDVAIISKYPVVSQKYHNIDISDYSSRPTRGILEAKILISGVQVSIFANHWPSQGNPDDARLNASKVLKAAASKTNSDVVIAAGDFNTLHDDAPHGIQQNILPIFEDVEVKARKVSHVKAPGTHWYRGEWESLDKIFVLKSSLRGRKSVSVMHNSYRIIYEDFMLKDIEWTDRDTGTVYFDRDIPNRYDAVNMTGFSDHLPVAVTFRLN